MMIYTYPMATLLEVVCYAQRELITISLITRRYTNYDY